MRSSEGTIVDDIFRSELALVMSTCMWDRPDERKRVPAIYGEVMVVSCQWDKWWYNDLIGMTFFCELRFEKNRAGVDCLKYAHCVKLTRTKVFRCYRDFDIRDIIIV